MPGKLYLHPSAVDHAQAVEKRTGTYAVIKGGVVELRRRHEEYRPTTIKRDVHLPPWLHDSHRWCKWRTDHELNHGACPCSCHGRTVETLKKSGVVR